MSLEGVLSFPYLSVFNKFQGLSRLPYLNQKFWSMFFVFLCAITKALSGLLSLKFSRMFSVPFCELDHYRTDVRCDDLLFHVIKNVDAD